VICRSPWLAYPLPSQLFAGHLTTPEGSGASSLREALILYSLAVSGALGLVSQTSGPSPLERFCSHPEAG
jgi:hypothetical protein